VVVGPAREDRNDYHLVIISGGADEPPKFLFFTVKNEELTLSKGPQGIKKVY